MGQGVKIVAVALVAASLSGCASSGGGMTSNQAVGTGVGATTGAVAGALIARGLGVNPVVGALVGGVAGGLVGNAIGTALDENERQQLAMATREAAASAPVGKRIAWSGAPQKKTEKSRPKQSANLGSADKSKIVAPGESQAASGWVIPTTEAYQSADGKTCRDLQQFAEKDGKSYEQKITACKTASGWELPA